MKKPLFGMGSMILALLGGFVLDAAPAAAGPRYFVNRDGTRVELVRSDTELAVEFADMAAIKPCAKRFAQKGVGIIEDYPGSPESRFKLLRAIDASSKRISDVRQDAAIVDVRPVYYMPDVERPFLSSGTLLVRVKEGMSAEDLAGLWSDYRVTVIEPVEGLKDTYSVRPVDDREDEILRAEALAIDRRTVWAQPNLRSRGELRQVTPSDEYFGRQWHLLNTGQEGGQAGADINVLDAWTITGGGDVRIGMFDDACDIDHEDLRQNYLGIGSDATLPTNDPDFNNPEPKQIGDRHGTAVMGLAVASANAVGGRGVAFLSQFTVSRGVNEPTTAQQKAGVYTFARQQDVDVHINSWGLGVGEPIPAVLEDAIETAFREGRDPDGSEGAAAPREMVIVFATGNEGVELEMGDDLSTLPWVIGVGASNNVDARAEFSNYGADMEFLAPGGDEGGGLLTTDNDDARVVVESGYNAGGDSIDGPPDIDPDGKYTQFFAGTSAACPVVAGTAALCLSANPSLTATGVRTILEHTCDRVNADAAAYDPVTGHSTRYGYGRINASAAVDASVDAVTNGGRTWPVPVTNAVIEADDMTWASGRGTREFLIIESPTDIFDFEVDEENRFPVDGACYSEDQLGCSGSNIQALPTGVTLTSIVSCPSGDCANGESLTLENMIQDGRAYAIYGRSGIGRYSWGVTATRGIDNGGGNESTEGPKVTIMTSVTEGDSPLTVQFSGNAERTDADVDLSRAEWDFNVDDDITINATTRNATYTYEVAPNEVRTFLARLTMYDVNGMPGVAQVAIRVEGPSDGDFIPGGGSSDVRILVGVQGSVDSDVDTGTSPFQVLLSVDAETLVGELESISWDLGDGTTSSSLVVPHTYVNETEEALRIPITARITTRTSLTTSQIVIGERVVTVLPGSPETDTPDVPCLPDTFCDNDGSGSGGGTLCGAIGLLPLALSMLPLALMRRRR